MDIRQPAAHLDQMIRQTRAHHVQLSAMAECVNDHNKAYKVRIRDIYIIGLYLARRKFR